MAQALVSLGKSLGLFAHTVQDLSFGVDSYPPRPYQQIVVVYVRLLTHVRVLVIPMNRSRMPNHGLYYPSPCNHRWRWQRRPLLLLARLLVYPIFLLSWVLTAPVWVLLGLLRSAKS